MKEEESEEMVNDRALAKVRKASEACGGEGSTGHHSNPLKADPQCNWRGFEAASLKIIIKIMARKNRQI